MDQFFSITLRQDASDLGNVTQVKESKGLLFTCCRLLKWEIKYILQQAVSQNQTGFLQGSHVANCVPSFSFELRPLTALRNSRMIHLVCDLTVSLYLCDCWFIFNNLQFALL